MKYNIIIVIIMTLWRGRRVLEPKIEVCRKFTKVHKPIQDHKGVI